MKKAAALIISIFICAIVKLNAQPTTGLVGYFKFSNNILNSGSASITATATAAPYTTGNNGAPNSAIQFSGTTASYVSITDNGNLDFAGDFSVSFGVMITSTAASQGFFDNNINYGGYGVFFFSNTVAFISKNGSILSPAGLITANTWKAICVTRSGGALSIYINGTLVASGAQGSVASTYTYAPVLGQMYFAGSGGNYNPMNGKMDEVRLYNRALSAAEALSLVPFTLPLSLLEFNGHLLNNSSVLNWKTSDEINTASFDIEKSNDGRNYTVAGNVRAFNTPGIHQYSFMDNISTAAGVATIYYRLKQKDADGTFTYSRIVALKNDKSKQTILLYPNPVVDAISLTVTASKTQSLQLNIIDNAGRIMTRQKWNVAGGSSSLSLDVSALAKGIYYLGLTGETVNERKQFIKL